MTGDGWPDLMGQPDGRAMLIYPGNGMSGLKDSYVAYKRIKAGVQVPVGRWDGDGAPDSLFRSGKKLSLYPGNGPGGFLGARPLKLSVKQYDWMVGVGDMGINGHAGVVVRERKTGYLWLLPGTATGFSAPGLPGAGLQGVRPGRLNHWPGRPHAGSKRSVHRSASKTRVRSSSEEPETSTTEPLAPSGSVKADRPEGEAGFAVERSRPPPE